MSSGAASRKRRKRPPPQPLPVGLCEALERGDDLERALTSCRGVPLPLLLSMVDDAGLTLLTRAVRAGDLPSVATLLRLGARVYWRHLLECCLVDHVGIAEALISARRSVSGLMRVGAPTKSMFGRHPQLCHLVMCCGVPATHGVLLRAIGRRPVDVGLLEMLFQAGITPGSPHLTPKHFCFPGSAAALDFLLSMGADSRDLVYRITAHPCCVLDSVVTLEEHGFGPSTWHSPLSLALGTQNVPLIERVLASGAFLSVGPYEFEKSRNSSERDIRSLLLEYDACPVRTLGLPSYWQEILYRGKSHADALRMKLEFGAVTPVLNERAVLEDLAPMAGVLLRYMHNHVSDTDTSYFVPCTRPGRVPLAKRHKLGAT